MAKSKKDLPRRDALPEEFGSLDELWAFWDTHSTADYEDLMEDADFRVNIRSSKTYCAVANDIVKQLRAQARRQGVSTETLINLWLRDKVKEVAQSR
jgi:hypothetical protein